jgi:pyruvate dehydrogenase E2 component (dihydrolipoamide acetyltransferase)
MESAPGTTVSIAEPHRTDAAALAGPVDDRAAAPAARPVPMAAPVVRELARSLGVDLGTVTATGPRGRVTEQDVRRAADVNAPGAPAVAAPAGPMEIVPFRGVRRRIAEAMELSARTIPHVVGFHELDAAALGAALAAHQSRADAAQPKLGYLHFIVAAVARTLSRHPYLNASLDAAAGAIQLKKFYNIGIATKTNAGLLVPVVHGADGRSVVDIAREIDRLAGLARAGALAPADLHGGTFTISNVGGQRGWLNTSLIRVPEVAILGVGRVEPRAVVRDGAVVARPILPLALTFDHRVIDGEQALAFMLDLRCLLEEDPAQLVPGASD